MAYTIEEFKDLELEASSLKCNCFGDGKYCDYCLWDNFQYSELEMNKFYKVLGIEKSNFNEDIYTIYDKNPILFGESFIIKPDLSNEEEKRQNDLLNSLVELNQIKLINPVIAIPIEDPYPRYVIEIPKDSILNHSIPPRTKRYTVGDNNYFFVNSKKDKIIDGLLNRFLIEILNMDSYNNSDFLLYQQAWRIINPRDIVLDSLMKYCFPDTELVIPSEHDKNLLNLHKLFDLIKYSI